MNRACILPIIALAFSTRVTASPDPPLPWVTSNFSVALSSGTINFRMDCPNGKLTRLTATRGAQVAEFPMDRMPELGLTGTCSGVSTIAGLETEGLPTVITVELRVKLSREYILEELWISLDLQSFKFSRAQRLLTYPGENTQVTKVPLQ
jgi:hypothetical protein